MKLRKFGLFAINTVLLIFILFFFLISPYDYEWNLALIQIDDDKLLVLRFGWILVTVIDTVIWSILKPKKISLHLFYGFIMLLAVIKIVSLFLI